LAITELSAVTFAVGDMARALAFYRAVGFTVKYGDETSSFTSLLAGAGFLNLIHVPNADVRWWGRAIFYVDDVDAQHQLVLDAGITALFAPEDARWGERYFHIKDPDGHEISFAKPLRRG
jgi:catechol 2,3-dioxygenase-like lactoylglutathione lyase family enzyme